MKKEGKGMGSNSLMELILANLPGHVYWKDKDGVFLGCNEEQAKSAGFQSSEEMVGKTDFDMPWKSEAKQIRKNELKVMKEGKPFTIEEAHYLSCKAPLYEKGEVIGVLGVSIDLTKYQSKLEERNHTLEEIIAVMPGHVYWKNRDCILQGCNDKQAVDAGLRTRQEIVGKTAYDLIWQDQPEDKKQEQAAITNTIDEEVMSKNQARTMEEFVISRGNEKIRFLSEKVPLHDRHGNVNGLLGISLDITEKKHLEEELQQAKENLQQSVEIKEKFLRVMQHEIRNKLTGILSFSDLLLCAKDQGFMDDHLTHWLTLINESGKTLIPTLDRINNYLSLESGKLKPYHNIVDMHAMLFGLRDQYQSLMDERGIQITFELDEKVPKRLLTDYGLVRDVMDNLLFNAIRHSPDQGTVNVQSCLAYKKKNRCTVDLIVQDEGIGMPRHLRKHLFGLLERPDEETRYSTPGLNLSISYQIAKLLGGELEVGSKEGQGATFILSLELEIEKAPKPTANPIPRAYTHFPEDDIPDPRDKTHLTILIAEDDTVNSYALKELLEINVHCDLLMARSYRAAKALLDEHKKIDLILMDMGLPDEEGHHIVDDFVTRYPKLEDQPVVVAVTAHAREVDMDYFLSKGITDLVSKPISLEPIVSLVRDYFGEQVLKPAAQDGKQ